MASSDLTDHQKELFKHVTEGNVSEIKLLISDNKVSVNCYDHQDMTPLQHAAFKGHLEVCKLLLGCGADVNLNRHPLGYSALCLAAISNHCDVTMLLLEHGADATVKNSNNRTPAEMAAFVGSHKAVSIINNYISKDAIDYFTEPQGVNQEPKLPAYISGPVHKLVIIPNIHPVCLILHLQSNNIILQNAKVVINVLNILSEKMLKENHNDRLSIKVHYFGYVLQSASEFLSSQEAKSSEENVSDNKILDMLIKSWLKGSDNSGIPLSLEKFLRKSISAYPFSECMLFQHIASTIFKTDLGNEPNALTVLGNAIIGPHCFSDEEACATCGEQKSAKKCAVCKSVQYCNKMCQKLLWIVNKTVYKGKMVIQSEIV